VERCLLAIVARREWMRKGKGEKMEMEIANTNSLDVFSAGSLSPISNFWSDGHDGRQKGPLMDGRPTFYLEQQGRVIKMISRNKDSSFICRLVNIDSSE